LVSELPQVAADGVKKTQGASVSSQRRSDGGNPSKFINYSNGFARAEGFAGVKGFAGIMTAGAAVAIITGLSAPASALPTGLPQDVRPAATAPSEAGRPANVARPRTPANASSLPGKPVAKQAPGAKELPAKPKGPLQIVISLDKQQLTLYAGSEPIAHSRVSTGTADRPTPTGVFSVIQKDRWHRSNLYDDAPMYFMQRITWSGLAMHQGIVPNHPASHGCIRLPEAFAQKMWGTTGIGVRVIIARNEAVPVEISHPRLFAPKPPSEAVASSSVESLQAAQQAWKIAALGSREPIAGATATDVFTPSSPAFEAPMPVARPLKPGPISVFISRKEGKLYVRKGFAPLFDVPVAIEQPDQPLGTHVFTAIARKADDASMRWTVVSTASSQKAAPVSLPNATAALDRITIPQDALDRISALAAPGASLIISDQGLSQETGIGTDFIVLTR
jgi:lipoprotein-anchoring transpeptidase ErfK/SrfK